MNELSMKNSLIIGLGIIFFGVIARFFLLKFVGIPNFEIITALTLVSAVFLGRAWGIAVPLSIIAITDVFIGNGPVMIFTWSAFAIIGFFGVLSRSVILSGAQQGGVEESRANARLSRIRGRFLALLGMTTLGIISSVFFFLYTNFGWWLMTNMYPHTWDGLIQCYIMGLPFFKNNLIGNLFFVPMASSAAMYAFLLKPKFKMFAFSGSVLGEKN